MTATIEQVKAAGGYKVIYADPAWSYSDKGCNGAADKHYNTMSVKELCALPVKEIASSGAVLFLWVVNPLLPEAFKVAEAWGFRYKTKAFEWVKHRPPSKANPHPHDFMGLGHWTRGNTESCLLFVRGGLRDVIPKPIDRSVKQVVWGEESDWNGYETETVSAPLGRHSAKPPEVRERIVQMLGDIPRIELFARERACGFDVWGNELDSDIIMERYPDAA